MAENAIGIIILAITAGILLCGCVLVEYVLSAVGLYKLASLKQVSDPWMSWLPIFKDWIVGKIAEKQDESEGVKRKWGILLVLIDLIVLGCASVFLVGYFVFLFNFIEQMEGIGTASIQEEMLVTLITWFILILVVAIVLELVSMASVACMCICWYKVFESCVQQGAWKSWLIYLLVPIYGCVRFVQCVNKAVLLQQEQELDQETEELLI